MCYQRYRGCFQRVSSALAFSCPLNITNQLPSLYHLSVQDTLSFNLGILYAKYVSYDMELYEYQMFHSRTIAADVSRSAGTLSKNGIRVIVVLPSRPSQT